MVENKSTRTQVGKVVSDAMDKTVVVLVETKVKHPVYKKYVSRRKKFYAHDEENACKAGDVVVLEACKPLSRTKRWTVREVKVHAVG